jgi:hypothetical protein
VVDRSSTRVLASEGSRIATSPEIVATRIAPPSFRSTSAVTRPLTVLASSRSTVPSATVRSPETELKPTSPSRPCASTSPDRVLASTAPVTPSSVIFPETLLTEVVALIPDTTRWRSRHRAGWGTPLGTMIVMAAEWGWGRSQPSSPSQLRSG